MATLTKKQRASLELVLRDMKRARNYIFSPTLAIAHKRAYGTTTLDYVRPDGTALYEVTKEYGSDLCGLDTAIAHLERFLAPTEGNSYHEL
jgi:hypothetical protein